MLTKKDIRDHIVAYRKRPDRTIKCRWSVEAEQDLKAYHSVDIERELITALANSISEQVDAEFLSKTISK